MKIDKGENGKFGDFKIYEREGREIINKFIDLETKLLIVREKIRDLNVWGGYRYEITTINPENGNIIKVKERRDFINYEEEKGHDEKSGLTWITKRQLEQNGRESIKIKIYHHSEKEPIKSEFFDAFSDKPHKTIPNLYQQLIDYRKEDKIRKEKALADYLKKNYEERVKYWSGNLHQQMRWNGESSLDEYAIFSKKWLEEVKQHEPNIERMLEDVFEKYWKGYWNINEIRKRLKK